MARVLVFVMVGATGCAQLAGIDNTSEVGRGGNTVTVTRLSIGTELKATPLDLNGLDAMYFVPNPANPTGFDRVLAADHGAGKWTADLPEPASVELTVPDVPTPIPRLFAFPSRELQVLYSVLEHPTPAPAPPDAMINLTVHNGVPLTAADGFQIYTVGAWTVRGIAAAELPVIDGVAQQIGPLAYPFASSSSLSGRGQLDRLTTADRYLVLRHVGALLTGFAEATPFDQTGADTVDVTTTQVTPDQMLDVSLDPAKLATRYASVRPAVTGLQLNWSLTASPAYLLANGNGPGLHGGGLAMTDVGVKVAYGNPFATRGWHTLFTLATAETRTYTPAGTATPVQLVAGMNQFIEPSAGFALALPAGLPELISLDGMPLSTDGQAVAAPSKFVEVTFIADSPSAGAANATLYNLQVYDLLPNAAGTALEYHLVLAAAADQPKFEVPPEVFVAGHSYTLRALVQLGGYPNLAAGDFVNRTLPLAQSYLDSAVITVTP